MERPPEGKRQASFPGAVFSFRGLSGRSPNRPEDGSRGRSSHAPLPAYSRATTAAQPASSTTPHKSSIQKTHLLSTQRST